MKSIASRKWATCHSLVEFWHSPAVIYCCKFPHLWLWLHQRSGPKIGGFSPWCCYVRFLGREGIYWCEGVHPQSQIESPEFSYICIQVTWTGGKATLWAESMLSETCYFYPLSCQPLVVWAERLPHSIRDLCPWLARKGTLHSQTVNWVHYRLSFALLRALIMSIRGAWSSRHHAAQVISQGLIDLQMSEGQNHLIC